MAVDQTRAEPDREAVTAALAVLDRFMAALNAGEEEALLATLHFPHCRLAGAGGRVAETRTGKNRRHLLAGLLRQSVFGRLAGYEDVEDRRAAVSRSGDTLDSG